MEQEEEGYGPRERSVSEALVRTRFRVSAMVGLEGLTEGDEDSLTVPCSDYTLILTHSEGEKFVKMI